MKENPSFEEEIVLADAAAILICYCFLPAARDSGLAKRHTGKLRAFHSNRFFFANGKRMLHHVLLFSVPWGFKTPERLRSHSRE